MGAAALFQPLVRCKFPELSPHGGQGLGPSNPLTAGDLGNHVRERGDVDKEVRGLVA
jgi:uncharacterized protein YcbX